VQKSETAKGFVARGDFHSRGGKRSAGKAETHHRRRRPNAGNLSAQPVGCGDVLFELADHIEDVVADDEERGDCGQSCGNMHDRLNFVNFSHQHVLLGLDVIE
jgi:hypothetical protein